MYYLQVAYCSPHTSPTSFPIENMIFWRYNEAMAWKELKVGHSRIILYVEGASTTMNVVRIVQCQGYSLGERDSLIWPSTVCPENPNKVVVMCCKSPIFIPFALGMPKRECWLSCPCPQTLEPVGNYSPDDKDIIVRGHNLLQVIRFEP